MLPHLRLRLTELTVFDLVLPAPRGEAHRHPHQPPRLRHLVALAIRRSKRFGKLIVADTLAAFPEPARVPFRVMAEKVSSGGMQPVLDTAIGRMFPPAFAQAHPDVIADRKAKLGKVDVTASRARVSRLRRWI